MVVIMMNDNLNEICYKHTYLNQVIIRLDFCQYINSDILFSGELYRKIVELFPQLEKPQIVHFEEVNVNVPLQIELPANAKRNSQEGFRYTFCNSKNNKVILTNKAIVFEINAYESYDKVKEKVVPIISSLFGQCDITIARTGIRYINIFDSQKEKIRKKYFSANIAASFESKLPLNIDGINCARSMHLMEYVVGNMQLRFRYGMYNPSYPNIMQLNDFVLDYDCFTNEPYESSEDSIKYIDNGHHAIQRIFENSITDELRKHMLG